MSQTEDVAAYDESSLELSQEILVPAKYGKAFPVERGQIMRVTQQHGPQVVDVNVFNADNHKEHFWAGRTRIIEAAHLTIGHRLWSVEPWMNSMFTIVADTVTGQITERGARFHDMWYPRCNNGYTQLHYGETGRRTCHVNMLEAGEPFGIPEYLIHDTINLFQRSGLDRDSDTYFAEPTASKVTDYVDLRADMDCLVIISACPGHLNPVVNDLTIKIYDRLDA